MTRRIIIDTDTASDDAVALIMAVRAPQVEVEALTVVAGNVPVEQASINARYTLQIATEGMPVIPQIPVYTGAAHPLERAPAIADWFHGPDGMGNMNYPPPKQAAADGDAVSELINRFTHAPGEMDLITLGPLTNIAKAILRAPEFVSAVKHCYVMGGAACTNGNVTPAAEYNIWCDPEAAHIVFHSGIPLTMIGWELSCGGATLDDQEMDQLLALGTERARLAINCNSHALQAVRKIQGEAGLALADPVAMAVALDSKAVLRRSSHYVDISRDESLTRGMTVVDKLNVTGKAANVDVCWELNNPFWKTLLRNSLT